MYKLEPPCFVEEKIIYYGRFNFSDTKIGYHFLPICCKLYVKFYIRQRRNMARKNKQIGKEYKCSCFLEYKTNKIQNRIKNKNIVQLKKQDSIN